MMMSPAHVLEPTYQAIKKRLMEGAWPGGFRLDTARLADDLGVSKSPVRDSLNHLAGERMVDFEMGAGFHVPRLDEKRLQDMLDLNLLLLVTAAQREATLPAYVPSADDPPTRAAVCFLRLAHAFGNGEMTLAIAGLNDRLAAVRHLEPVVLSAPEADLDKLEQTISGRVDRRAAREGLTRYHNVRKAHASVFVRLRSGAPPTP
jgi:hypothetical protein